MAAGKSPAFQFYPSDWLAGTMTMSCAERGAYINLLSACWNDGSLPIETDALRRISGAEMSEWEAIKGAALAHFRVKDGRYINGRLEKERAKQRDWSKKSREGGRASAAARRLENGGNQTSTNGQPQAQPLGNSSSSSLSSSSSSSSLASSASAQNVPSAVAAVDDGFERWYAEYPKCPHNNGPIHPRKVWRALKPEAELQADMIAALRDQKTWTQWTKEGGQFIPTPQKWLTERRWMAPKPDLPFVSERTAANLAAGESWLKHHGVER